MFTNKLDVFLAIHVICVWQIYLPKFKEKRVNKWWPRLQTWKWLIFSADGPPATCSPISVIGNLYDSNHKVQRYNFEWPNFVFGHSVRTCADHEGIMCRSYMEVTYEICVGYERCVLVWSGYWMRKTDEFQWSKKQTLWWTSWNFFCSNDGWTFGFSVKTWTNNRGYDGNGRFVATIEIKMDIIIINSIITINIININNNNIQL